MFGAIAPDWQAALFPPDVVAKIGSVATLSVVLYTFVTGMHLNIAELRGMRGWAGSRRGLSRSRSSLAAVWASCWRRCSRRNSAPTTA
ncbi:hypothetical protein [Hankyongella ginsenosidimutans]|uniref:hypothetical protein n=1 Tax=Hankyongella ginsenosidimutans TaxID=1763828 RepID=UPI001FED0666|nr:hypothetical protein [Hankyongella ginsenosidimutans]